MASQDNDALPGFEIPQPPRPKKRKLVPNNKVCVICQKSRPDETVRKGKASSVLKLKSAAEQRFDDEFKALLDNAESITESYWHLTCYASYTSSQNIRYASSPVTENEMEEHQIEDNENRASRSLQTPTDWSKCFICQKITYKKSKELTNVCTFEACQSIRTAAEGKDDSSMIQLLNSVNDDLIAAEAKYHKNCFALYVSKKNVEVNKRDTTESLYDIAFQDLVNDITAVIDEGRAYDMTALLATYRDILAQKGGNSESYTTQRLKARLQKHFSHKIVFHQPTDRRKSELVYSSNVNVQDILNAWAVFHRPENEPLNEEEDAELGEIYPMASFIKREIQKCKGISTRPLDTRDINASSTRTIIPDSLYLMIKFLITNEGRNKSLDDARKPCTSAEDERKVLSIAQDIIHCCTNGTVKLPKHTSLAICVHHLTSSKRLIALLNRMGHCVSYDEMRGVNTSIALEVLSKAEEYGTVIPSNILPGPFVQLAADNNDLNEETIDGKNTTHATTMVIYQRKAFGPDPPPNLVADQGGKRRSLQTPGSVYEIEECAVGGRRPVLRNYVSLINDDWYQGETDEMRKARRADAVWALLRLCPRRLGETVIPQILEKQPIPSWSGFNAILYPDLPAESNIGYCPMIDGSSTEYSTIYTVLKHAQKITAIMEQRDTVITFDLLIYIKAKEIQWRFPEEFSDVVIRLGGFHIALNFLSLLGKKFTNSGLDDLLIESGVYASGTTSVLMKGKSYNRGIRAHKLCMEVFFRLMWNAFLDWYASSNRKVSEESALRKIASCVSVVDKREENILQNMQELENDLTELTREFDIYKAESREKSQLFAFWEEYGTMVMTLLQFVKAERMGNWKLHLSSVASMIPHFFAMDRQNYARYLPVYIADMQQLELQHPDVLKEFESGNHSVSRSGQSFSQVSTDMALEQSINADSKSMGGIIGISQNKAALERWFLTIHERASITTALKEMFGLQDGDQRSHKEAAPRRVQRDEEDVKKMVECFTSGLMTDPFTHEPDGLLNFATGVVLPDDVANNLLKSTDKGREQMTSFIEKRLDTNDVGFWEPISMLKIKTFSSTNKVVSVKSKDTLITVNADRDFFGRLLIVSNVRQINLKEILCYELSPVPCALAHQDGSLRKTPKCMLASLLEKKANALPRLLASPNPAVYVFDGMAVVQMSKSAGANTFGELSAKYYNIFTAPLNSGSYEQVHVVFDQYWEHSIKAGERARRGQSHALEVRIGGPATPIPKQWGKYIGNPKNKVNLCEFLTTELCRIGQDQLPQRKVLVVGGGSRNGREAIKITRGQCIDMTELHSDHEEADTRMLLHASHAASPDTRVVIQSPDTDVLALSTSHFRSIGCRELWFRTGVKDRQRFIPVHQIAESLGERMCKALLGFHAVTGCDSTSSLLNIGKKSPWDTLNASVNHQESLSLLGEQQELDDSTAGKCESFICDLYPLSGRKKPKTTDEMRYLTFCQAKKKKSEKLPPTSDALLQHLKRSNYQSYIWKHSLEAVQDLDPPEQHGWQREGEMLNPVLMTKVPAPESLLELTSCKCKKSECQRNCSCNNMGLACTEACLCMADEDLCKNPNGKSYTTDSEASDED